MSLSGWLKSLALRRSEGLSCRPFDSAQDKLRPASIFACTARPKKTWIPAYAGMTTRRKRRLLVDELRTPRLVAKGRSVFSCRKGRWNYLLDAAAVPGSAGPICPRPLSAAFRLG